MTWRIWAAASGRNGGGKRRPRRRRKISHPAGSGENETSSSERRRLCEWLAARRWRQTATTLARQAVISRGRDRASGEARQWLSSNQMKISAWLGISRRKQLDIG